MLADCLERGRPRQTQLPLQPTLRTRFLPVDSGSGSVVCTSTLIIERTGSTRDVRVPKSKVNAIFWCELQDEIQASHGSPAYPSGTPCVSAGRRNCERFTREYTLRSQERRSPESRRRQVGEILPTAPPPGGNTGRSRSGLVGGPGGPLPGTFRTAEQASHRIRTRRTDRRDPGRTRWRAGLRVSRRCVQQSLLPVRRRRNRHVRCPGGRIRWIRARRPDRDGDSRRLSRVSKAPR